MVLEATVICVDNSEWMRNGDYPPTRFQAQNDAVNLICGAKTQSNPENTVGVLTMAGKGVRVLVTPTADLGKVLSSMHGVEVGGQSNVLSAVQVAQLALKHRQNKNQQQRIVLFSGSPITADIDTLVKIGKKLKKNNVALDIVSFGDDDPNTATKLESLLGAVNSNDNSHLVHVPPTPGIVLSDVLISSPIFTGDGERGSGFAAAAAAGAAAAAAGGLGGLGGAGGAGDFDFGVDPNLDPELALALRVSMEEERARQEAAAKKAAEEAAAKAAAGEGDEVGGEKAEGAAASATAGGAAADVAMGEAAAASGGAAAAAERSTGAAAATATSESLDDAMDDEAALLQQALAMSLAEAATAEAAAAATAAAAAPGAAVPSGGGAAATAMAVDAGEDDDELALALQMSMQQQQQQQQEEQQKHERSEAAGAATTSGAPAAAAATEAAATAADMSNVLGDAAFVNSILSSLPGVDPNDPSVRDMLASLGGGAATASGGQEGEAMEEGMTKDGGSKNEDETK